MPQLLVFVCLQQAASGSSMSSHRMARLTFAMQTWLQAPMVSRPTVGHALVNRAASSIHNGSSETPNCPYRIDTWSSPFTVAYLNVGRHHLVGSLPEVVKIVLLHRPDILFLGDLVTSRAHIGRLKQRLENELQDEWFITTNISTARGNLSESTNMLREVRIGKPGPWYNIRCKRL
jgi:hypothetical protein